MHIPHRLLSGVIRIKCEQTGEIETQERNHGIEEPLHAPGDRTVQGLCWAAGRGAAQGMAWGREGGGWGGELGGGFDGRGESARVGAAEGVDYAAVAEDQKGGHAVGLHVSARSYIEEQKEEQGGT